MYRKCPKCGHERTADDKSPADVCAQCGLIFSKYLKARVSAHLPLQADVPVSDTEEGFVTRAKVCVFYVPERVSPLQVYARAALLVALVWYGIKLAKMDIPSWEMAGSLIHLPMVPFHEFGHIFFRAFGDFM